jgi:hypothetical protein
VFIVLSNYCEYEYNGDSIESFIDTLTMGSINIRSGAVRYTTDVTEYSFFSYEVVIL